MQTWKCEKCGYKFDGDYLETCPSCKNSCTFIDASNYVPETFNPGGTRSIKLYCDPFCPLCKEVSDFLKKEGIDFTYINLDEDDETKKQLLAESGQDKLPIIKINNELFSPPFDEDKLNTIAKKA